MSAWVGPCRTAGAREAWGGSEEDPYWIPGGTGAGQTARPTPVTNRSTARGQRPGDPGAIPLRRSTVLRVSARPRQGDRMKQGRACVGHHRLDPRHDRLDCRGVAHDVELPDVNGEDRPIGISARPPLES